MQPFEELFVHKPEYQVIICRRCRYAVNPAQIKGHIQSKHQHTTTKQQTRDIARFVDNLSGVARRPKDVVYPNATSEAISELSLHRNGMRCKAVVNGKACNQVYGERSGMQRHCRTVHGWKNPRRRGKPTGDTNRSTMWDKDQPYQQFFRTGSWQKCFAVKVVPEPSQEPTVNAIDTANSWMDGLFEAFKTAQEKEITERCRYEANPWLEHTGWERHIKEYRSWVVQQIREVNVEETSDESSEDQIDSERALGRASKGTAILIRRSFEASRVEIVGRHALHCINRRENGAADSNKPFYSKQKVQTIRKYISVWVKVLRYIWRTEAIADRPQYRLTSTQKQALDGLRQAAGEGGSVALQTSIVEACSAFWVAMFKHELRDDEYESGLLSGLAVLGIDNQSHGWTSALNYTPKLAAIITSMRAIVVRRAWRAREDHIKEQVRAGVDIASAEDTAPVIHRLVQEDVESFMTMTDFGGQPSPINTIYTQKMYGMKIRYTTNAEGQTGWTGKNNDVIMVRKIQFSMDQIRSVIFGLLNTARQRLAEELLFMSAARQGEDGDGADNPQNTWDWHPDGLPRIHLDQISDNQSVLDEGWSFLNDSRNKWPVDGRRWIGQRLLTDGTIKQRIVADEVSMALDPDAVEAYLRKVKRWKEEMLVLIHMSAGAPARGTELVSIQHENGENARSHRGIYIDQGMVVFTTSYHKGFSASQSQKCIHRFVPDEVGELMVYYLWLVEPFVRLLQGSRGQHKFCSWLWEPAPEEEWEEAEEDWEEAEEDNAEVEQCSEVSALDGEDNSEEARVVRQHIVKPAARNCDGYWETNRIRRIMRRESERRIGVAIGTSDWRQAYPEIHRRFAINQQILPTLHNVYDNDNPNKRVEHEGRMGREEFRARQAGHSPQMEAGIYGRPLQESPFTSAEERKAFREVSVDWHRFVHFPSSYTRKNISPDVQRRIKQEDEDQRMHRWQQMRSIDVGRQLKKMYGPQAEFRGKQREALDLIVSGHPRIIVVMRTGGGKSLLFMLPAAASIDGVTIVVMPKIMLQEDMADRCRRDKIGCAVWSDNRAPPADARIVFVIAESAASQSFADFVNAKTLSNQLERIVIDECHTVLQSTRDFRPKVLQLRELISREVQVVCLTATLPPRREDAFMSAIDIDRGDVVIVRESTVRPNIAYSVTGYEGKEEMDIVRRTVDAKMEQYPVNDRVIVYCRTIKQMQGFQKEIGGVMFHNKVGDIRAKREIMEMLTKGNERLFWSTSALGEGIDASTVRVVINVGIVSRLDDFAQQSGRCGRDGTTASESIVLRRYNTEASGHRRYVMDRTQETQMVEYLEGDRCRRVVLDRDMDGNSERTACRTGEQFCDVCRGLGKRRMRVVPETEGNEVVEGEEDGEEFASSPPRKRRRTIDVTPARDREAAERCRREMEAARKIAEQRERQKREVERQQIEIADAERQEYQRQQQERRAIRSKQQWRHVAGVETVNKLVELFEEWSQGCNVCRIEGRAAGKKGWRICAHEDRDEIIREVDAIRGWLYTIKWQPAWVACQRCWVPRAICHRWEAVHNRGPSHQYREQKERECQYRHRLNEAAAIMIWFYGENLVNWIAEQAARAGIEGEESNGRWCGSLVKYNEIEMSGLCYLFCTWAERGQGMHEFGG